DLHLVHEVTSPQAFEGLRLTKRRVRRPDLTIATMDHDVPTVGGRAAADELAERQMSALEENCRREGIRLYGMGNARQGIVHVIGPELGLTQPGLLIVCGDSHTSTHRGLSMEGRMTVCNMTIEGGARAGMIAPDDTTFAYLRGREYAPAGDRWDQSVDRWRAFASDHDAIFDRELTIDAGRLEPYV